MDGAQAAGWVVEERRLAADVAMVRRLAADVAMV